MKIETKKIIISSLSFLFLISLILVQWKEVNRQQIEVGHAQPHISVPHSSQGCVDCHREKTPSIVSHWESSTHALKGVSCMECHTAHEKDPDSFMHEGRRIATIVTPKDCAQCHTQEAQEFALSHHAKGGNILASLDNFLAETVEGSRVPFNPHSKTPGADYLGALNGGKVNGMASAVSGCMQCHGSKVAFHSVDGGQINVDDLKPDEDGFPTNHAVVAKIKRDENGKPLFHHNTWPNTGIGRINVDGSLGSCAACHSRHDFSPRRARQPENCAKCHLGPDHPQKEIYEESKHGVAYRDLKVHMNLDAKDWILGQDYNQAPTCATCHMSGNSKNGGKITHDPGKRISWTNRPPISLRMDTDAHHKVVKETDPEKRQSLIVDTADQKRSRMKNVCLHCHSNDYVNGFYKQYDDFIHLYNEKFAKPGQKIIAALKKEGFITPTPFDDKIEWTWFYLWHHEGRRARHGASMMAPDYAHWHGMYEVAERFYMELIPEARELLHKSRTPGSRRVEKIIEDILSRPEHQWFSKNKNNKNNKK